MKKKCSKRTHELIDEEKKRVMEETLKNLRKLRQVLESKKVKLVA